MAQLKKRLVKKARIEIIPLIDVIFFLLATFVLFTLSLNRLVSVPVDLPESVLNPDPSAAEPVVIQVSDTGTYFWNKEIITGDEIERRLRGLIQLEADPRVLVAGDQYAQFGGADEAETARDGDRRATANPGRWRAAGHRLPVAEAAPRESRREVLETEREKAG